MNRVKATCLAAAAGFVLAFAAAFAPALAAEQVAIGLRNNGDIVRLKGGQSLVVQLPVDGEAGPSWAISVPPTAPLRLSAESLGPGGEGGVYVQRLEFSATGSGQGKLSLSVVEPFLPGRGQRLVYEVTVEVR